MAKTPTSSRSEAGAALIEAAIGLGLFALIAAAGFSAFTRAAETAGWAEARLEALASAENALERAAAPAALAAALEAGGMTAEGPGWRVETAPLPGEGPLALLRLTAVAGAPGAEVTLQTVRSLPR